MNFKMQAIDDLDTLKEQLVSYEESHLQRYPDRWLELVIVYLDLKTCLDELVANIFKHGYPDQLTTPQVVVSVRGLADCLEIEVTDNAVPLDSSSLASSLGIIHQLADRVDYQQLTNGNQVTIFKQTTGG